jgi:hypothetical protein
MAKARSHRHDKAHVGGTQLVQRVLVMIVAPAPREVQLVLALQHGSRHRQFDELAVRA